MREQKHKMRPKRAQRVVQHMIPGCITLPSDRFDKFVAAFAATLHLTKNWSLSTDFQHNVNAALEREQTQ